MLSLAFLNVGSRSSVIFSGDNDSNKSKISAVISWFSLFCFFVGGVVKSDAGVVSDMFLFFCHIALI